MQMTASNELLHWAMIRVCVSVIHSVIAPREASVVDIPVPVTV